MESADAASAGFALRGVALHRDSRDVLRDLDFFVAKGEIHALVGARNEGKSLICSLLSGELKPDRGTIESVDVAGRTAKITNTPQVFPNQTVGNNLILECDESWRNWFSLRHARLRRLKAWLDGTGIVLPLDAPLYSLPREDWLFVQILNRLYLNPDLIIFDEAMEELTPQRFRQLGPLLEAKRREGMSFLWATNKIEAALVLADRMSVLRGGKILMTGSARSLDRLGIIRLCHGFLEANENEAPSHEQFYQMMYFTEALLRDLPNAVIITDTDLAVRFINQSGGTLFGIPKQWTMDSVLEEILGKRNERLAKTLRDALSGGGDREWHSMPIEVSGGKRLVDIRARLIREGEIPVGHMLVIEDVSVREELRQRLMLSENLASVGLLAAGVAHEVNNPLEVMENYLNYLNETEDRDERKEIISQVTVETRNIREIIRQLVAFSGQRQNRRVKTDMPRLARELCSLLRYHVKGKGIEFLCRDPGGKILVLAAPSEMRQMLLNLLRNSIDAITGPGGTISIDMDLVCSGAQERLLRIVVEDNGCGIDEEQISDIFLPFVSTKNGTENHQGLGLSIVHAIVESCGGDISVENRREGGCRFIITMPCLIG